MTGTQIKLPDFECGKYLGVFWNDLIFKILHTFLSKLIFKFVDNQVRPSVFQPCELSPCAEPQKNGDKSKSNKNGVYKWDYGSWGSCSAACLGGNLFYKFKKIGFVYRKAKIYTEMSGHDSQRCRPIFKLPFKTEAN